ncbi:helix-turn-helix domain-containing protein [Antarcticimicrobium sediminis]|nr:helix-turn-helix transcriptional regulator [Antarcticimicrobium sediminis]
MNRPSRSPPDVRNMFGTNLKVLSRAYPSVSDLSRRLGINRTQLNRYLSGESFPRPDVLDRICTFFDVDARILLEPVETLTRTTQVLNSPYLADFMGAAAVRVPEESFPSGFYRFSRRSFIDESQFSVGLIHVLRNDGMTFVRGFEPKEAMRQQGLPSDARTREYRGYVTRQEDGIAFVIARHNVMTCSFNYLSRVPSFENNFWVGYSTRTIRETVTTARITRMAFEYLAQDSASILAAARSSGFHGADDLLPFHKRLLQIDEPFR